MIDIVDHKYRNREDAAEGEYIRLRLPNKRHNELFAIADRLLGGSRINMICEDGKGRLARIPGKMKRRARVRAGDLCIIQPWDIQNEKADIIYRYSRTQSITLSKQGLLPEELNVF
ncbi:MAG: translation initiation factor eIF-1A [Candidatus Thermoplasmatota archaeon]|nr:translation initiation factor eIF-1A [Candidatus Thermoplasmatota archaeon]MBU1940400.1 translation initiation factor eIF-1A [Candidatus Thermoplasmatota archaeon]